MRKIVLGLAPALALLGATPAAAAPAWKVSEVSGTVRVTENGQSRAAIRGALLASGATITTGTGARAVIVRGEEFVVVSPASQLRVPIAAEAGGLMQMIEDFGTALFRINKKSTPHFGVQTPYLAAVVKGTTFTVTVGPEGGSVQVTEGAVQVSTLDGGASDLVTPGVIASVGAGDRYQLRIDGDASKVIRSSNSPQASAAPPPAVYHGPSTAVVRIAVPVVEVSQSLYEVTDGLLQGSATIELASSQLRDPVARAIPDSLAAPIVPPAIETPAPPPQDHGGNNGNATGNPGVGNNGNGSDRGNGAAGPGGGSSSPPPAPAEKPLPLPTKPAPAPSTEPVAAPVPQPGPPVPAPPTEPVATPIPQPLPVPATPTPALPVEPVTVPVPQPLPPVEPSSNSGSGSSGSGSNSGSGSSGSGDGNSGSGSDSSGSGSSGSGSSGSGSVPPAPSAEPAPAPVVEPVPVIDPAPDPAVEPVAPIVEPVAEPVVDPVKPTVEPIVEPVTQPIVEILEPIVAPAVEPVTPVLEPALDPIVEPLVSPTEEPQLESQTCLLSDCS